MDQRHRVKPLPTRWNGADKPHSSSTVLGLQGVLNTMETPHVPAFMLFDQRMTKKKVQLCEWLLAGRATLPRRTMVQGQA
jgi:hypothetical protein